MMLVTGYSTICKVYRSMRTSQVLDKKFDEIIETFLTEIWRCSSPWIMNKVTTVVQEYNNIYSSIIYNLIPVKEKQETEVHIHPVPHQYPQFFHFIFTYPKRPCIHHSSLLQCIIGKFVPVIYAPMQIVPLKKIYGT